MSKKIPEKEKRDLRTLLSDLDWMFSLNNLEGKLKTVHDRQEAVEEVTSKFNKLLNGLLGGQYTYAKKAIKNYIKPPKKIKKKKHGNRKNK